MNKLIAASIVLATAFGVVPAAAQDLGPTLNRIKQSGTITLGHRETSIPFSFIGDDQKPQGYTVDICMRIVEEVKKEIDAPNLQVKFVPVTPQTRIPLTANGTVNLECGSTTYNLTRSQQVDYSFITFITGTKLLVKKGSGIAKIEDLAGKSVGLAQGTTNERVVKEALERLKVANAKVLNVKDHAQGFLALETDRIDAYATDDILLYGLISKAKSPEQYEVVGPFYSYDPYAIMMQQNDSRFRLVVNRTLAKLFRSGEIAPIYDKWFQPMNVPMSDLLKANFQISGLPD